MEHRKTDWKLVSNGLLAIYWLMESNKSENAHKKITELYSGKFKEEWKSERLFNTGELLMAASLLVNKQFCNQNKHSILNHSFKESKLDIIYYNISLTD